MLVRKPTRFGTDALENKRSGISSKRKPTKPDNIIPGDNTCAHTRMQHPVHTHTLKRPVNTHICACFLY